MLPRIHILATGGTISAKGGTATQMTGYTTGLISVQDIIDSVQEVTRYADITGEQVANVSSPSLTHTIWLQMARRINDLLASSDVDGVVITHGTSTIEETGYFLNLTVKSDKPVVLTGAMRPATAISADGPINLLNAVRLAASHEAIGKGILVALNDQINSSRDVTKTSTMAIDTFKAPELGLLGYMQEGRPYFLRQSTRRHTVDSEFAIADIAEFPRVDIIYGHVNDDAVHIDAAVAAGAKGIVMAAPGHGTMSDVAKAGLISAQLKGVVIVKGSRCGNGMVTRVAEDDRNHFIAAGSLNPQKTRILLMLALTKTNELPEIQRIFDEY